MYSDNDVKYSMQCLSKNNLKNYSLQEMVEGNKLSYLGQNKFKICEVTCCEMLIFRPSSLYKNFW